MKANSLNPRWVAAMVFLYPVLLLTVRGGANGLFFLLALVSLGYLWRVQPRGQLWDGYSIAFALAMASYPLAVLLSQIAHVEFRPEPYDGASRFLLAIPIFLMFRDRGLINLTILQYAFPMGAIAALVVVMPNLHQVGAGHRVVSYFLNPIHLGDLALLLGFISLFSINWIDRDNSFVLILKIVGFCVGLLLSIGTGSRGGWVAIPVFVVLLAFQRRFSAKAIVSVILILLLLGLAAYHFVDMIHLRFNDFLNDVVVYGRGNRDTSTGLRIQIWEAALFLFSKNPIFGIGPDNFRFAIETVKGLGMISPEAIIAGGAEVHNEILSKTVTLGIFGVLSIFSIYLVPLYIFAKFINSASRTKRNAAWMGICLVCGFFVFGLTVEIFDLKMTETFYTMTLALLLAAVTNRQVSGETVAP
jgi:O-antigen ligase